jgi:uncharacterized repeat protein (TIGR01451 family)
MPRLGTHLAVLVALLVLCAPAAAQQPPGPDGNGSDYFVTIAARQCPDYTDIAANRARNNIQESLKDLGPDSPYGSGDEVSPAVEEPAHPNCSPLVDWVFTQGRGIAGKVTGPWGSLSVVSSPFSAPDITTQTSVPNRDAKGRIVAGTLAGATTIELTQTQADLVKKSSALWIQGGTPTDPVLASVPQFRDRYGFGALRCAIDNYNGDNVEWIQVPQGARHVYCYAYYVTPPPTSGTIVIRKQVTDPPNATQTFEFEGNVSYNEGGKFQLSVNNGSTPSITFYRAETAPTDEPWTARELVPPGWVLTDLACTRRTTSVITTDQVNAAVSIRLRAGDTVTCTFTNALRPPPGQLLISKVTFGDVGSFGFEVEPVDGGPVEDAAATTETRGIPVLARPSPIELEAGDYFVSEQLPRARGGRWRQVGVNCNARERAARAEPTRVSITAGRGVACVFANRFVPRGSITILKETRGAGGTTGFVVESRRDPTFEASKTAVTSGEDDVARARGDSTRRLPLGRYTIQETGTVSDDAGRWTLVSVSCSGRQRPFAQGEAEVRLTRQRPRVVCRFVNAFTPDVPPVPPDPDPDPPQPSPPVVPTSDEADLVVTKRALQRRVPFGEVARFEITVRNNGPDAAEQVVLVDALGPNAQLVSARPSQGSCNERKPLICRLGSLLAGQEATVRVRVRAVGIPVIDNLAVTGSSTPEASLANNTDRARTRVISEGGILGTRQVCPARVAC